jgi:hypothetical protein
VSRILARHGMPPLATLDPVTGRVIRASRATARRYERDAPGDLVHVDVEKLGRIPDGGPSRSVNELMTRDTSGPAGPVGRCP